MQQSAAYSYELGSGDIPVVLGRTEMSAFRKSGRKARGTRFGMCRSETFPVFQEAPLAVENVDLDQ
jgi:hypothetical protein